jgi:hypothetical protein
MVAHGQNMVARCNIPASAESLNATGCSSFSLATETLNACVVGDVIARRFAPNAKMAANIKSFTEFEKDVVFIQWIRMPA